MPYFEPQVDWAKYQIPELKKKCEEFNIKHTKQGLPKSYYVELLVDHDAEEAKRTYKALKVPDGDDGTEEEEMASQYYDRLYEGYDLIRQVKVEEFELQIQKVNNKFKSKKEAKDWEKVEVLAEIQRRHRSLRAKSLERYVLMTPSYVPQAPFSKKRKRIQSSSLPKANEEEAIPPRNTEVNTKGAEIEEGVGEITKEAASTESTGPKPGKEKDAAEEESQEPSEEDCKRNYLCHMEGNIHLLIPYNFVPYRLEFAAEILSLFKSKFKAEYCGIAPSGYYLRFAPSPFEEEELTAAFKSFQGYKFKEHTIYMKMMSRFSI